MESGLQGRAYRLEEVGRIGFGVSFASSNKNISPNTSLTSFLWRSASSTFVDGAFSVLSLRLTSPEDAPLAHLLIPAPRGPWLLNLHDVLHSTASTRRRVGPHG